MTGTSWRSSSPPTTPSAAGAGSGGSRETTSALRTPGSGCRENLFHQHCSSATSSHLLTPPTTACCSATSSTSRGWPRGARTDGTRSVSTSTSKEYLATLLLINLSNLLESSKPVLSLYCGQFSPFCNQIILFLQKMFYVQTQLVSGQLLNLLEQRTKGNFYPEL